jgi:hypothetical protein
MIYLINIGICIFFYLLPIIVEKVIWKIPIQLQFNRLTKKYTQEAIFEIQKIIREKRINELSDKGKKIYAEYQNYSRMFDWCDKIVGIIKIITVFLIAIYPFVLAKLINKENYITSIFLIPSIINIVIAVISHHPGRFQHQRKDGHADLRYSKRNNRFIEGWTSSIGIRAILSMVIMIIAIIVLIILKEKPIV